MGRKNTDDEAGTEPAESGQEPTDEGPEPTPEPSFSGSITIDGETYTARETDRYLKQFRTNEAKLRKRAKEAERRLAALEAAQEADKAAKLKQQGKYQKLYEDLQVKFDGLSGRVSKALARQKVEAKLMGAGVPADLLPIVTPGIQTSDLTVDLDTLEVRGDVDEKVQGLLTQLQPYLKTTAPAPEPTTSTPAQPKTEITERRRKETPEAKPLKMTDVANEVAKRLEETGALDSKQMF